ncbi:hypothetical protein ACZ90_40085 [Streptomyces albus subsp. albus]|nr:hypothetical protein ACZ90_40085 [Streptomyces albus subsp. albus]
MSIATIRRTAVRAVTTATLAAALLAPAATALAAGPAPARHTTGTATLSPSVRTVKLADGSTGRVRKLAAHHYTLETVSPRGEVTGKLDADGRLAGGNANGMFVVLTADGEVRSWIGGGHRGPGPFPLPDGSTAEVAKVAPHHYALKVSVDGRVVARVRAVQRDVAANLNGMFLVLTFDGQVSASL